jgi:hypothetical protein
MTKFLEMMASLDVSTMAACLDTASSARFRSVMSSTTATHPFATRRSLTSRWRSVFRRIQRPQAIENMAERVGFESTSKRNFRELRGMMSILGHSKKPFGSVIAP